MNVSIETLSGLERRLTIALPSEDFESEITTRLEKARGQVKIPGFRAGKVPLREVRRRYGPAVRAEVAGEMMQNSFITAVQQESLEPAGSPNLEVVKMDPGIDFEFTATFEVYPNVTLGDFSQIAVKQPVATIEPTDVDEMIDRLLNQDTTYTEVEHAAGDGDRITVDFEGSLDGEKVEAACGEGMAVTLGQKQMIADFETGLLGLSAGESKTFDATFPEDYRATELQGKSVQFTVNAHKVEAAKMPELNAEFFAKYGVETDSEDEFREQVTANMQQEMDSAVRNQLKQQVMDGIASVHEFTVPQALVQREIQVLKDQMMSQFQLPQGGDQTNLPSLPDELFHDQAQKRVLVGLAVNEVISAHEMVADEAVVDARLAEIAAGYGEAEQVINWYKSNPEQLRNIEMGILEDRVVDHILSQSSVTDVACDYKDAISGKAIAPEPELEAEAVDNAIEATDSPDTDDAQKDVEKQDE